MVASVEDAEGKCESVETLDFETPEQTCKYGLFIKKFRETIYVARGPGRVGNISDMLKVTLFNMSDLRDFNRYQLWLVLNGTALLFVKPTLPTWMVQNYKSVLKKEFTCMHMDVCEQTAKEMALYVNKYTREAWRQKESYLFLFPEGIECTTDMLSPVPHAPTKDELVMRTMNEVHLKTNVLMSEEQGSVKTAQKMHPQYWHLRIIQGTEENQFGQGDGPQTETLARAYAGQHTDDDEEVFDNDDDDDF